MGLYLYFYVHIFVCKELLRLLTMIGVTGLSIYMLNVIQTEGIIRLDFGGWNHLLEFYL